MHVLALAKEQQVQNSSTSSRSGEVLKEKNAKKVFPQDGSTPSVLFTILLDCYFVGTPL